MLFFLRKQEFGLKLNKIIESTLISFNTRQIGGKKSLKYITRNKKLFDSSKIINAHTHFILKMKYKTLQTAVTENINFMEKLILYQLVQNKIL